MGKKICNEQKHTMHIVVSRILAMALVLVMLAAMPVFAVEGSMGYEGGISMPDRFVNDTYTYSEVVFVTGKPILMKGTLVIKKSDKGDTVTATYTYKLADEARNATLTRVNIYDTKRETKANGQIVESTKLSRQPTEVINAGGKVYTLLSYDFARSALKDPQPAIHYTAGEISGKKVYRVGTGATAPTVTIESTGKIYAFDQYWNSAQTLTETLQISYLERVGTTVIKWGGTAEVTLSGAGKQRFMYLENEPYQISFSGGYVRSNWNDGILDYNAKLPEFDKNGKATDRLLTYADKTLLESEPIHNRLMVPDLNHMKGYFSLEPIRILFGIGVIAGTGEDYNPAKYVTRSEYIAMVMRAIKDIPADPNVRTTAVVNRNRQAANGTSPFLDVKEGDANFAEIEDASKRGIIYGRGQAYFRPKEYITRAEAVTILVRALGLGGLAPANAVTPFIDNDMIPSYARNSVKVASDIGLLQDNQSGIFSGRSFISNEQTALMLYRLIVYMGDEIAQDYRDRMFQY